MSDQELPVSDLLAVRHISDAGPNFWNDLEVQLANESAEKETDRTNSVARVSDTIAEVDTADTPTINLTARRARRWAIAASAAAAVIVIAMVLFDDTNRDGPPAPVVTDITTTTLPTPSDEEAAGGLATMRTIGPSSGLSRFDAGFGALWVVIGPELVRIDAETGEETGRLLLPADANESAQGPHLGAGAIWVTTGVTLHRVDPDNLNVVASTAISADADFVGVVAVEESAVWLQSGRADFSDTPVPVGIVDTLHRVDPATNTVVANIDVGGGLEQAGEVRGHGVWVEAGGSVHLIDPATNAVVSTVDTPDDFVYADAQEGAVWFVGATSLHRVDPTTQSVVATVSAPDGVIRDVLFSPDTVWIVGQSSVQRVDPVTNRIVATIDLLEASNEAFPPTLSGAALVDGAPLISQTRSRGATSPVDSMNHLLFLIDPNINDLERAIDVGLAPTDVGRPVRLLVNDDTLWIITNDDDVAVGRVALDELRPRTTAAPATTGESPTSTIPLVEDATLSEEAEPLQLFNPDWQAAIDARLDVSATVEAVDVFADEGATTSGIAADAGSVWISTGNSCPCELIRIDPATSQVVARLEFTEALTRPLVTAGGIWVAAGGTLYRIDPQTNDIAAEIEPSDGRFTGGIAATSDAVWALAATDCCFPWDHTGLALVRIDPGTNSVVATIGLGVNGFQPVVAASDGDVWVSGGFPVVGIEPTGVERIDPTTDAVVATIELPGIAAILIGDGAVWAFGPDALHRIDPVTNTVVASIPGPNPDGGFDVNLGRVLLENAVIVSKRGWLYRIDTSSTQLETVFDLGDGPFGPGHLATAGDDLWIAGFVPDVARIPLDELSQQPQSAE